jgi:cell pole-organizing protein PopZ
MADKRAPAEEPSIEEILGSIRRIIAEEDEPGAEATAEEEEPLELTNKIDTDGTIVNTPAAQEPPVVAAENRRAPAPEPEPQAQAEAEQKIAFVEEEAPKMAQEDTILSQTTADATAAVMSKLARQTVVTEEGHAGVTLEGIVREMLRPLLRDWLDQNLPNIVEKVVERELERLSRRV